VTRISDQLDFEDLQTGAGLAALDAAFIDMLKARDAVLHERLLEYREEGAGLAPLAVSALLIAAARHLEDFIAQRFGIDGEVCAAREATLRENAIPAFKQEFVQKRARRYKGEIPDDFETLHRRLRAQLGETEDMELAVARLGLDLLANEAAHTAEIERLTQWCVRAAQHGQHVVRAWASFRLPQPVDPARLVPLQQDQRNEVSIREAPPGQFRRRDGFDLTDGRWGARPVQDHVHYCVYCHEQEGDFCSKGFPEKKKQRELGLKANALGVTLTGCPLEEKISEMHVLKRDGYNLAALAMAMADNPMIPATGHRICNDCMKACIYQKQEPVNIPQIETRVLTDTLALPWGVEIYDLLARWNPLRRTQYLPKPDTGHRVLIAGMGPAGFTLAHHLTMEGCAVVGIDGLKIEPLPDEILRQPVRDYTTLCERLSERTLAGFGGVAEYGITVRWDKNFLRLVYLTLARRERFQCFGGVRLGGTVTLDDAWSLGFDHVALANGAGLPRVIHMGESLARGMRQASDFLMALQLTGAAKSDSLANLQIRLPAVVIGGGLTAIDAATELQAYYVKQVEKTLARYEALEQTRGRERIVAGLDAESVAILEEFLDDGRQVRAERERAARAGEEPDFVSVVRALGGVTVVYRKSINESPAYLRNHEEIVKAMEEGIYYAEGLEPVRAELDEFGHARRLICRRCSKDTGRWLTSTRDVKLPARTILVAAGTFPNTIYEREYPGTLQIEHNHFLPHVVHGRELQPVQVAPHCKASESGPFTSYAMGPQRVSFLGDAHPVFNGSVVKAIASASRSYPAIVAQLRDMPPRADTERITAFRTRMTEQFSAYVARVRRLDASVIEMWIHAPLAARNFRPGQFFRLQTFECMSEVREGTRLQIPLYTVSGAGTAGDEVRLLMMDFGAYAKLAARLKPGDPLILMGPTGAPAPLPENKTVLVVAQSWGAAVMLPLGAALKARGNRVLLFAMYPSREQIYCRSELENATDRIVWAAAQGEAPAPGRPQDLCVTGGDIVGLLRGYAGAWRQHPGDIPLSEVSQIQIMGSTGMLRALQFAMKGELAQLFAKNIETIGTVGTPMQCMLKGVCAQCLHWQVDPETGKRTRPVFSCAHQDQPLSWIDVENVAARQRQNRVHEHLTNLWVDHLLGQPT
jgi:NADPH-dependent glutamate synthase beta subunit-like oxidoreductase/NAD(P)H-flavin reductase